MDDKWKRKVDALILLAKDQKGKPEGEVAQAKLQQILDKHPVGSAQYEPFRDYIMFSTREFVRMKRAGENVFGRWQGDNLQDAIKNMILELMQMKEGEERTISYGRSPLQDQILEGFGSGVEGDPCQTCDGPCPGACEESKDWPQDEDDLREG